MDSTPPPAKRVRPEVVVVTCQEVNNSLYPLANKLQGCTSEDYGVGFFELYSGTLRLIERVCGKSIDQQKLTFTIVESAISVLGKVPADTAFDPEFIASESGAEFFALLPFTQEVADLKIYDEQDFKVIEGAFSLDYKGLDIVTAELIAHLQDCLSTFEPETHYALCVPIVNASMMGKSRMVSMIPEFGVFLFTVSFQRDGYPTKTHVIADLLLSVAPVTELWLENRYHWFFYLCFKKLFDWLNEQPRTKSARECALEFSKMQKQPEFWESIVAAIQNKVLDLTVLAKQQEQLIKLIDSRLSLKPSKKLQIVFVFDEAAQLVNYSDPVTKNSRFHVLRRCFRCFNIYPNARSIGVVTDTA